MWGFNQVSWYRILCLRQNSVIHLKSKLRDDFEIYAISLTLKMSFISLSNLEIENIFKICRPSWFQNCPWLFHLIKNWMRCLRLKRRYKQEWSSMDSLEYDRFYLLKVGLGAMLEVFPWASWTSNNGFKAFLTLSHTQIFDIWRKNQNFPPGSLEDGYVPERRILPQFLNKAIWSKVLKTKVASNNI